MLTLPLDTGSVEASSANPVIAMVAGDLTDRCLIFAHVPASGFQIHMAACSGVIVGGASSETVRGSIAPFCMCSPGASTRIPSEWSAKETSTTHRFAVLLSSRQRKVGGVISGGNTEPSSGYSITIFAVGLADWV